MLCRKNFSRTKFLVSSYTKAHGLVGYSDGTRPLSCRTSQVEASASTVYLPSQPLIQLLHFICIINSTHGRAHFALLQYIGVFKYIQCNAFSLLVPNNTWNLFPPYSIDSTSNKSATQLNRISILS